MKKLKKQKIIKNAVIAISIIFLILFSGITSLVDWSNYKVVDPPMTSWHNPSLPDFFYEDDVDQTTNYFNAYNESYILCKVQNTAYANFTFNNTMYNVSYGINSIPIDFGAVEQSYSINITQYDIDRNIFDWIAIQPLYIKEDFITVNMSSPKEISFDAGGMVSILLQPNFTYNDLYLEVDNVVINNDIYNTSSYSDIESDFIITWEHGGTYLQFDLHIEPKQHLMKIKGNGTIDYKIISSYDWDEDFISDVEEVQTQLFNSELDPTIKNVWGYFVRGDTLTYVDDYINETGLFYCYIPEEYTDSKYLSINVLSGIISNIIVDEDSLTFKDVEINTDTSSYSIIKPYGLLTSGFHFIEYKYEYDKITYISFNLGGKPINILDRPQLRDTDADGVKNVMEVNSGSNVNNPDTDNDGLIDGLDTSPLTKLTLGNDEICQLIIPHDQTKNTLIDIVIQKPEDDYSTGAESKIWNGLEVSIYPIMRLFGNSSITMSELTTTWDKSNKTYSLTDTYPTYGDGLPTYINQNEEMTIIPAILSGATIEFSFNYTIDNVAKDDNVIDIRFDIVWTVVSNTGDNMEIIHYYDFDEDINIQSITMRETQNVTYILASPDSMIENEILWNLVQNDNLGSFSDFGISEEDDIVDSGTIDYNNLISYLNEVREENEISTDGNGNIDENEVTYISMNYTNYDILNRINIINNIPEPSFEVNYSGDFESFFSYYSISEIKNNDEFSFKLGEDFGDHKTCYIKSWNNYTNDEGVNHEERFNIIEFPILMNRTTYNDAEILEITSVNGPEIPLNKIPYTIDDNFHDKITLTNETYIEKIQSPSGTPMLSFDNDYDIYKEILDNRLFDVDASKLIFESYSKATYVWYINLEKDINDFVNAFTLSAIDWDIYMNNWNAELSSICSLYDIKWFSSDYLYGPEPKMMATWTPESIMGLYRDTWVHKFRTAFSIDQRLISLRKFQSWMQKEAIIEYKLYKQIALDEWVESMVSPTDGGDPNKKVAYDAVVRNQQQIEDARQKWIQTARRAEYKYLQFRKACRREGLKNRAIGILNIGLSILYISVGIGSIIHLLTVALPSGEYDDDPLGFISRFGKGITMVVLSIFLGTSGIYYLIQAKCYYAIPTIRADSIKSAFKDIALRSNTLKNLGKICIVISILLIAWDLITSIADLIKFGGTTFDWIVTIAKTISLLIPIGIMAFCTNIGGPVGFIAGILITIGWMIWDWLTYQPYFRNSNFSVNTSNEKTYFEFPEADFKRNGGLEVGDTIKYHINVTNEGTENVWMRTNFSAGGGDWSDDAGKWATPYTNGQSGEYTLNRTLQTTQYVTELKIGMEIDLWDGDSRENVYNDIQTDYLPIPILDVSISNFYDDLTDWDKPNKYRDLINEYEKIKNSYQYEDVVDILEKLSNRISNDFFDDDIDTDPDYWDESYSQNGIYYEILRPNEDIEMDWEHDEEALGFLCVDEDILYPVEEADESIVSWTNGLQGGHATFGFTIAEPTIATKIELYVYGNVIGSPDDTIVYISYDGGDNWDGGIPLDLSVGWGWDIITYPGLSIDETNDIQIDFYAGEHQIGEITQLEIVYLNVSDTVSGHENTVIKSELYGHTNIVKMQVLGDNATTSITKDFGTSKSSGIIEFWVNKDNFSQFIADDFFVISNDGNIIEGDGETIIWAQAIISDLWNNFRIIYDSTHFDLYLNGIKIGDDIEYTESDNAKLQLSADTVYNAFNPDRYEFSNIYIDAIDFNWTSNYYPGRSYAYDYSLTEIQEYGWLYGNLSIFTDISTDLSENIVEMNTDTDIADFDFYLDLEGTHNPTVNYTFSLPDGFSITPGTISQSLNGNVEFEISANDPYQYAGIYYFEMNITFSDNSTLIYSENIPFRIPVDENFQITQSNIIFEEDSINGDYTATDDFLGDTGTPDGWVSSQIVPTIVSNIGDHNDVVRFNDNSPLKCKTYKVLDWRYNETVEFWIRKDYGNTGIDIHLYGTDSGEGQDGPHLRIDTNSNGLIEAYYDGKWNTLCSGFELDKWYHLKISFNTNPNYFNLYLDDYLIGYELPWAGPGEDIYFIFLETYLTPTGVWYFDAMGVSWDSNYIIGDNMYKTSTSSDTYGSSTQLEKGDVLFIEYKTNSKAEIIMDFLNNDVIQASYTVSTRGNLNLGIQYQTIVIDDTFSFDEIEFSSYEYNYFEVYHISILDAGITASQKFNPLNFTNTGNVPKFVTLELTGELTIGEAESSGDTGWVEAQIFENIDRDGERSWSNPSNAELEDGNSAISDINKHDYSDWLRLTNFYNSGTGYNIPSEAEIIGIEVKIKRKGEETDMISDDSLRLRITSGQTGDDKASGTKYTTTLTWATYGSSSDDWNAGLTPTDLNSADFGIELSSYNSKPKAMRMGYVDAIFIKIHYLIPSTEEIEDKIQIIAIEPNSIVEADFTFDILDESSSNLLYRGIMYSESGTNSIYNLYLDNLEIDGIHIVSPENMTHIIIGDSISSGNNEYNLKIIPEETLNWMAYSLNGAENVTFTNNNVNITIPEANGLYTIQVFGENVVEERFESEIRYFEIKYPIDIWSIPRDVILYNTENVIDVNITSIGLSDFSYTLDGRAIHEIEGVNCTLYNIPYGERNIVIYGDDSYGEEWSSGLINFEVAFDMQTASLEDGFTITNGTLLEPYGDLQFIDGNYSEIDSYYGTFTFSIYINSISITHGWDGEGTLAGTTVDADYNYKRIDSEQVGPNKWVDISFNINPTYAGRDFLFDFWSYVSVTEGSGTLKVNGETYGSTAKTIHFHNVLFEDVTSITFRSTTTTHDHFAQINHFKLTDINSELAEINTTIDLNVTDSDIHQVEYLQYSHKSNVSVTIDLDIWDWNTEEWDEIESGVNSATFNDDRFTLGNNSNYLNLSYNGVRIRYQANSGTTNFKLQIDSLNLLYSTTIIPSNLNETPIQWDNFTFTKGTGITIGELDAIDDDFSILRFEDLAGQYPGTYSFEDDTIGEAPDDWDVTEVGGTVDVISDFVGHNKVLRLYDSGTSSYPTAQNDFDSAMSVGTIEWWVYIDTANYPTWLYIKLQGGEDTVCEVAIRPDEQDLRVSAGGYTYLEHADIVQDSWIHMRMDFDRGENSMIWYINGDDIGETIFANDVDLTHQIIRTVHVAVGGAYNCYVDAVGYSWDPNYNIGDNLNIAGRYPATYSFEDDTIDQCPTDWTGTGTVQQGIDGHDMVTYISGTGASIQGFSTAGWEDQVFGTIEFWWYFTANTKDTQFFFTMDTVSQGNTRNWGIMIRNGMFTLSKLAPTWSFRQLETPTAAVINTWHHFRLDFDLTEAPEYNPDGYSNVGWVTVTINSVEKETKGNVRYEPYDMTAIRFDEYQTPQTFYIDAVGYSWDPNYNIGDNLNIAPINLDIQVDLQVEDEDCFYPYSLSYSYKTNVSETINFDIWNWRTETWYEIESVDNSATFDDDIFWLEYNCGFVDYNNGIRIRFQAASETDFQLEIDRLRLDYYYINTS